MFYLFLVLVAMAFYFKVDAYIKYSLLTASLVWGVLLAVNYFDLMSFLFQNTINNF